MFWKITLAIVLIVGVAFMMWPVNLDHNKRENFTLLKMQKVEQACKVFRTKYDRWPEPEELVTGMHPLLEGGESALQDDWGRRLKVEVLSDDTIRVKTYKPDGWPLEWPAR